MTVAQLLNAIGIMQAKSENFGVLGVFAYSRVEKYRRVSGEEIKLNKYNSPQANKFAAGEQKKRILVTEARY